jgi:sugar phosphate isomerase/epimerase
MKHYKNILPFALGTTSYILHTAKDNLLANVTYLKDYFEIIQLLFFGKEYLPEVMSPDILRRLSELRQKNAVSYIIHLPLDLGLLSIRGRTRETAYTIIQTIINKTAFLDVHTYILHVDGSAYSGCTTPAAGRRIDARLGDVLKGLAARLKDNTSKIAVENTGYDLTRCAGIIKEYAYSVCMDVGHLMRYKHDLERFIDEFSLRIRVIHLHGLRNNRDHRSLKTLESGILERIIRFTQDHKPAIIIEVFNKRDLKSSLKYVIKIMKEAGML